MAEASHSLQGVRLGVMERWVLLHAPEPTALRGLPLEADDRSVREQQRRASNTFLLEREKVQTYVQARDPRREQLTFRDGEFWRWERGTRRHAVQRTYVWLSPLGWEISRRYRRLLEAGLPVRWDPIIVREVQQAAARNYPSGYFRTERRDYIRELQAEMHDAAAVLGISKVRQQVAYPDGIQSAAERARWRAAALVAHDRATTADAEDAWSLALTLYEDPELEDVAHELELRQSAERPLSRAELFRRRRVSPLGAVHSD